jgi:hypothetical protein
VALSAFLSASYLVSRRRWAAAGPPPAILISPPSEFVPLSAPADDDDDAALYPPDIHTFTSWTPRSWSRVNFDEITFPADSAINIRNVQSYMAVAMILWYDTALRAKYDSVWEALKYAWLASFDNKLYAVSHSLFLLIKVFLIILIFIHLSNFFSLFPLCALCALCVLYSIYISCIICIELYIYIYIVVCGNTNMSGVTETNQKPPPQNQSPTRKERQVKERQAKTKKQ